MHNGGQLGKHYDSILIYHRSLLISEYQTRLSYSMLFSHYIPVPCRKLHYLSSVMLSVYFRLLFLLGKAFVSCCFLHSDCSLCMLPSQMAVQRYCICYILMLYCILSTFFCDFLIVEE